MRNRKYKQRNDLKSQLFETDIENVRVERFSST